MKFDIKAHLQDHAFYFKCYDDIKRDDLHFNFSFLDLQFFNNIQPPEETLFELLQELKKPAEYKVRNGYYTTKDGEKKQKYTTRKIHLNEAVKIEAIHIEGADQEYTMPHIHLVLDKNARLGKDFSLLKTHISKVSLRYGLKPNFAEIAPNNPASYKNLAKSVKNFSWIVRKMSNKDFHNYVEMKLSERLDKLWDYALLSGNLQYYIKTLEFIKTRLNRQKIPFEWKGHNIRNTYPIPLTEQDLKVIDLINKKKFSQKDIKPYLQNAILRDFVRYSYLKNTNKALIIKALTKQTELLKNIRPNKRIISNYLKLYKKELEKDKQQALKEQQTQKQNISLKQILKEDLLKVAKNSTNEKELREKMKALGYKEFGFKKRSGKVIGYQFILPANPAEKIVVKCSDSIQISQIRAILKQNWIKSKKNDALTSPTTTTTNERSKINTYTLPVPYKAPEAVLVPYKTKQIEQKKQKQQKRRNYERDIRNIAELAKAIKRDISIARTNATRELQDKRAIRAIAERKPAVKEAVEDNNREIRIFGERIATAISTAIATTIREFRERFISTLEYIKIRLFIRKKNKKKTKRQDKGWFLEM